MSAFVRFLTPTSNVAKWGVLRQNVVSAMSGVSHIADCMQFSESFVHPNERYPRKAVTLLPPITTPDKVLCVGLNYRDHCEEQNFELPTLPVIFNKFPSTLIGDCSNVKYPTITEQLDYEVELAVVIGKQGKDIEESESLNHIVGYTVACDVTARDWQKKNGRQWLLGKSMDNFCPIGPGVVAKSEISDPQALRLSCHINGAKKQDGNTSNMIFSVAYIISHISKFCTLLPGDVILTGTPSGVGVFRNPPEFLKKGDIVECSIENIGKITNKII